MFSGQDPGNEWAGEAPPLPPMPEDLGAFQDNTAPPTPDAGSALWAVVQALGETQRQFGAAFKALTNRILAAPAPVAPPPVHTPAPTPSSSDPRGTPRFKEPTVFGGSASEVEGFIIEIKNAVYLQCNALPTDHDKCIYLSSYLKHGSPKSWYYGILASKQHLTYDFEAFISDFRSHFGDSNLSGNALRKLKELKQTGSCAGYASRSRELHDHLSLDDFSKIDYFYAGLKGTVKDLLITINRSTVFDEFVDQCIEIDNRVHDREVEKRYENSSHRPASERKNRPRATPAPPAAPQPSVASSSQVVPMEIDAVRRGPVTPDEKARRRREGLCYYCGQGKHLIDDCPNMSAKAKAAYKARAATRNAAPSGKA